MKKIKSFFLVLSIGIIGAIGVLTVSCSDFMEVTIVIDHPLHIDKGDTVINGIVNVCVQVESSGFTMGSPPDETGRYFDEVQREVTLTQSFCISKYPITNREFASVFPYKEFPQGLEDHPVVDVTWQEAMAFASVKGGFLPTEAQWEYAARGGHKNNGYSIYSGGNDIGDVAWYKENSDGGTHIVGRPDISPMKQPNELGIYDMSGNVYQWCRDWYSVYDDTPVTDPEAIEPSSGRVIRGGSWNSEAREVRIADRAYMDPIKSSPEVGFRVVTLQPRNL